MAGNWRVCGGAIHRALADRVQVDLLEQGASTPEVRIWASAVKAAGFLDLLDNADVQYLDQQHAVIVQHQPERALRQRRPAPVQPGWRVRWGKRAASAAAHPIRISFMLAPKAPTWRP